MVKSPTPRVYSYIRFSTPEQKLGDSERRQLEQAKQYAAKKGLELDSSLRDEGLSGFHGVNRTKGALGGFLKKVEIGEVASRSILSVENVDRLSREDFLQAFETISRILRAGVIIATLSPFAEYTRESIAGGLIWQLVGQMQIAYEESKKKSDRIRASRDAGRIDVRRANGTILTSRCPAWLRIVDRKFVGGRKIKDGTFEVVPSAVKTIKTIFDLKLKGIGTRTIEASLNKDAPWRPKEWRASYIKKILVNRAVIGEYQPFLRRDGKRVPEGDPIPGYFPVVVKPELFHAVQRKLKANRGKGGRTGKAKNLFQHLVKCAYCGGPMHLEDKGRPPKGAMYLVCDNGRRGVACKPYRIRYDECETTVLSNCHRLRPDQVLPNPDDHAAQCQAKRERLDGLHGEIQDLEKQIDNLTDQVARTERPEIRDRYEARLAKLSDQKTTLEKLVADEEPELQKLEAGKKSFASWKRDLETLQSDLKTGDVELRMRLRAHLQELIDRMDVFAVGHPHEYDPDTDTGDIFAEWYEAAVCDSNPRFRPDKTFHAFCRYVMQRRLSKEGRFLRLRFKSGSQIDIVPFGSIADGFLDLPKPQFGWKVTRPRVEELWKDFDANCSAAG